jgi:hypothetical protein
VRRAIREGYARLRIFIVVAYVELLLESSVQPVAVSWSLRAICRNLCASESEVCSVLDESFTVVV